MINSVSNLRKKWNLALFGSLLGTALGGTLMIGGACVVVGKTLGQEFTPLALWLSLGSGVLVAWLRFRKRQVDTEQMATLLDLRHGGTGEILHCIETGKPLLEYSSSVSSPRPTVKRMSAVLLPGVLFFTLASQVPLTAHHQNAVDPLSAQKLEDLQKFALSLEETVHLEGEVRAEVQERMDLLQSTDARDAATQDILREALDRMESRLDEVAQQTAQNLDAIRRSAEEAATNGAEGNQEDALKQLADLAKQLENLGINLEDLLTPELLAALQESLSPEMLANLDLNALADLLSQGALDKLKALAQKGLLSGEALAQLAKNFGNFQKQFGQSGEP